MVAKMGRCGECKRRCNDTIKCRKCEMDAGCISCSFYNGGQCEVCRFFYCRHCYNGFTCNECKQALISSYPVVKITESVCFECRSPLNKRKKKRCMACEFLYCARCQEDRMCGLCGLEGREICKVCCGGHMKMRKRPRIVSHFGESERERPLKR